MNLAGPEDAMHGISWRRKVLPELYNQRFPSSGRRPNQRANRQTSKGRKRTFPGDMAALAGQRNTTPYQLPSIAGSWVKVPVQRHRSSSLYAGQVGRSRWGGVAGVVLFPRARSDSSTNRRDCKLQRWGVVLSGLVCFRIPIAYGMAWLGLPPSLMAIWLCLVLCPWMSRDGSSMKA
ncbi:hypothetical protein HDV57DRAFT_197099 [Trichoderma longibrachiatum]|uniref:Uncharacterized protein n=1 Tax=Trichoderma longibrachiatum ATCC 18648 TaxID=983965 RepID=A0A2T4C8I0_TRILO|nr:hypothetical protein M440DRAFT_294904 [Trichoderma longibrachiatum ATCC 18648]